MFGVGLGAIKSMSLPVPSLPLGITNVHEGGNVTDSTLSTESKQSGLMDTPSNTQPNDVLPNANFEFVIKVFAIGSNILLQLSPLRLITEMRLLGSVGHFSSFPLVALTGCGFQWSFYGYYAWSISQNSGFLMLIYANILGLVLGMYYLIEYSQIAAISPVIYDNAKATKIATFGMRRQLELLGGLFAIEGIFCLYGGDVADGLLFSGALSALVSILVSASPMVAIPKIWSTQSTKSCLPIDMVLASMISSVLWLWCGYLLGDPWVWMPNLCGVIVGLIQVGIIFIFTQTYLDTVAKIRTIERFIHPVYEGIMDGIKTILKIHKPSTGETD